LNGETMTFRRKSWRRVVEETDELAHRHGGAPLQFSDNILGMDYFQDLLPHWAGRGRGASRPRVPKFFEIKSNLRRTQVQLLRGAGVTSVQAGVESLADGTLRRMRKGVPAARNLALIRWCVEARVRPFWNVLYGFPGESPDDYGENLRLLGKITHLPPPSGVGPIRLDRFSPNFTHWREHGFTAVRPLPAYRHLFPFAETTLAELAYYFDYEHPRFRAAMDAGRELDRFARAWRRRHEEAKLGELAVKPHWQGGFVLVDRRFNFAPAARRLSDREVALLVACDAPTGRAHAVERAAAAGLAQEPGEPPWEGLLDRLLDESAVARAGPSWITLALLPPQERLEETAAWRIGAPAATPRRAS
jgi:ribosomal peptide maturation radical SAM protein 1